MRSRNKEMTDQQQEIYPNSDVASESTISGKWVVIALLTFGVFTTSFMWIYTYLSNKPYIPLRHALVQEFSRASSPNVQGGKERGRGPNLLRIILTVNFDPTQTTDGVPAQVAAMERRAAELAREHLDLKKYELWAFILVHYRPEMTPTRWESKREISEIIEGQL
jgi:hypothetical protein